MLKPWGSISIRFPKQALHAVAHCGIERLRQNHTSNILI